MEEAYDHIITEYTESECCLQRGHEYFNPLPYFPPNFAEEKRDHMFASMMHQWGIHASALFSNVVRQCVDTEEIFEEVVNLLIVRR